MQYILAYIFALVLFFLVDIAWLGYIMKPFYNKHLGHLMREKVVWPSVIVFYLLYPLGLLFFAVAPALYIGSIFGAVLGGALFGFFVYMTYEFTNHAVVRGWSGQMVLVDTIWGVFLSALASTGSFFFVTLIL